MVKESEKGFVWTSLRISFLTTICLGILSVILGLTYETMGELLFSLLWAISAIFTFVVSIIHLTKYKKKGFAIVTLVLSSVWVLVILISFIIFLSSPYYSSEILINDINKNILILFKNFMSFVSMIKKNNK